MMQRADDDDGIGSPIVLKLALASRGRTKDNFEPDWKRRPISVEIYQVKRRIVHRAKIKIAFYVISCIKIVLCCTLEIYKDHRIG